MINQIPALNAVDFEVSRLANPHILWSNNCLNVDWAARAGYCIRYNDEPSNAFLPEVKIAKAERYGGVGLAGNSGGVRCGLINDVQVKGIGRNPLAGATTDYWHKHGACSITDGVLEAVWSEFLNAALPYGVARTLCIIGTGTEYKIDTAAGKLTGITPRALIVREPVMRPGHFLRSPYAKHIEGKQDLPSDEQRAGEALQHLAEVFRRLHMVAAESPREPILDGIADMTARFARQCGRARGLRISHGSLTASNFGLDGKWLDLFTVTTLPDYGQYRTTPGSMPTSAISNV